MKITIEDEVVDSSCYNCGEPITIDPDRPFLVVFELGEYNYPHSPDTPDELYLVCRDCIDAVMLDYQPGSDE